MQVGYHPPVASDLIVVARRWDGVGGRLHAILNAWSVARALDLGFRFVWPRNSFTELHEPREIFDGAFLARFEVVESALEDRAVLPVPTHLSLANARALCERAAPHSLIDIWQFAEVLRFTDEPAAVAETRFRSGWSEIAWSGVVRTLVNSIPFADDSGGHSALHVRAGDIAEGDWRQFVPVEKYIPTPYVEFAIESLGGFATDPVVVVSDNDRYVRYLKTRFDFVRSPGDLVPCYNGLSKSQQALADILVLSRARRIVGPHTSAFSQFAAHLGGLALESVGDLMSENVARDRLYGGVEGTDKEDVVCMVRRPLIARDICWYLDVFSGALPLSEYLDLARRAVRLEPDFCGALNRLCFALAFAGNGRRSAEVSLRAQKAAALVEIHTDPLFESLATSISAKVVTALGTRRHFGRRLLEWCGLARLRRQRWDETDRAAISDDIADCIKRCATMKPFQIHHDDVMDNFHFQSAAMTWFMSADERSRQSVSRYMRLAKSSSLELPSWRPSGFSVLASLSGAGSFPTTLRNLELTTTRIAQAIAAVLTEAASHPPRLGGIDTVRICPSGLRWAVGWAFEADADRSDVAVGLFSEDRIVSGGITCLPRPDVAANLGDPRAMNCGFAFPVPVSVEHEAAAIQTNLRIFSPGR